MAKSPQLFPELRRENPRFHVESNSFRGRTAPAPAPAQAVAPRPQIVPEIPGGSKPIINPLLQELFNKNSIVFQPAQQPLPARNNLPRFDVKRPALTFAPEEPRTFAEPQPGRPTPFLVGEIPPGDGEMMITSGEEEREEREEKQRRLFQSLLSRKQEKERRLQDILTRQEVKMKAPPAPPQFEASEAVAMPGRAGIISAAEAAVAGRQNSGQMEELRS